MKAMGVRLGKLQDFRAALILERRYPSFEVNLGTIGLCRVPKVHVI